MDNILLIWDEYPYYAMLRRVLFYLDILFDMVWLVIL